MLKAIIQREILEFLTSSKFLIGLSLTIVLVGMSTYINTSSPFPEYQGDKSDSPRLVESNSNLAHNFQKAALDLAGLSLCNLVLAGLAFWAVSRCDVR